MHNSSNLMKAGCLTLLSIMLASCEFLPPKRGTLTPLAPIPKAQTNSAIEEGAGLQSLQNKPLSDALQKKIELFPARDRFAPRTDSLCPAMSNPDQISCLA